MHTSSSKPKLAPLSTSRGRREITEIVSAEVAMGPYDVIARAGAADMDRLGGIVVNAVGNISGVERTLLCPIVNL